MTKSAGLQPQVNLKAQAKFAVRLAFSRSGTFLAISYSDDTVVLWRIDSAQELSRLRGLPIYPIRFLDFGPDDKTLITRDAKATVVWDISRYVD